MLGKVRRLVQAAFDMLDLITVEGGVPPPGDNLVDTHEGAAVYSLLESACQEMLRRTESTPLYVEGPSHARQA